MASTFDFYGFDQVTLRSGGRRTEAHAGTEVSLRAFGKFGVVAEASMEAK